MMASMVLLIFLAGGCGSTTSSSTGSAGPGGPADTQQVAAVTVIHDLVNTAAAECREVSEGIPADADSLEFQGYDSDGTLIYSGERRDKAANIELANVPVEVTNIHIDYLRNGGYPLRHTDVGVDLSDGYEKIVNPEHRDAAPGGNKWVISKTGGKYTLNLNGSKDNFTVKGVNYSPVPIGGSTDYYPNGDMFYETKNSANSDDWHVYYDKDLPKLRDELHANCIRIYQFHSWNLYREDAEPSWQQSLPASWTPENAFKHQRFLDKCYNNNNNPIYVMIGIDLTADVLESDSANWNTYFTSNIKEILRQYGNHPAVMGFCIGNEQNQPDRCYKNSTKADFFWKQIEKYAKLVKDDINGKYLITTIAFQDDPILYSEASSWMAKCPSIDCWSSNLYCGKDFGSFWTRYEQDTIGKSHEKPLLIGEWGCPGTTRKTKSDPFSISDDFNETKPVDSQTLQDTWISSMLNDLYTDKGSSGNKKHMDYCIGGFLFEYADEWWDQVAPDGVAAEYKLTNGKVVPYKWCSGFSGSFPGGYTDLDGFGLYSRSVNGRQPQEPWDGAHNKPFDPDNLTARKAVQTVGNFFSSH